LGKDGRELVEEGVEGPEGGGLKGDGNEDFPAGEIDEEDLLRNVDDDDDEEEGVEEGQGE